MNPTQQPAPTPPPSPEPRSPDPLLTTPSPVTPPSPPVAPLPPAAPPSTATPSAPRKFPVKIVAIIVAILVVASAAYATYLFLVRNSASQAPRVKVGLMMAFSGGSASMGYGANKGIQLAKKQLNADNIEIVQVDSKCEPKAAADAVKTLIEQKVVAIIGEGCSSATVAALPAVNNAKIPLISPSASSPTLSIPNDYFFRVVPPDNLQGSFMAQTIYDKGYRNVAVFYTNEPYGSGMNTVFRESFETLGGKVVASATAEPDVIDLKTQMEQLKAAKPQAIFIAPNSVVSATAAMKLAREVGVTAPFYGADIMYDTTIINNAPQAAEGLTISSFPTGTKAFKQALFNESQKNEELYAAPQAYDIINVLQLAIKDGAITGEAIKNFLPSVAFEGVSGTIKFDNNGEISDKTYKYDLFQVTNGTFKLLGE
jgi:branched-chain amino acid transport system substrate-binding protein